LNGGITAPASVESYYSGSDAALLTAIAALLGSVALVAGYIPACRAADSEPTAALRGD
jgi:hypothetical protein